MKVPQDREVRIWQFAVLFVGVVGVYALVTFLVAVLANVGVGFLVGSVVSVVLLTWLAVRAGFTVLHGLWFLVPIVGFGFMIWVLWELTETGDLFGRPVASGETA